MSISAGLRVLALLEAGSITGTAKAVLEMAYEARADVSGQPGVTLAVANFVRGSAPTSNALTLALDAAQIPYSFIREEGRFDSSVLPQIQNLTKRYQVDLVWTNSVKSHFLVNQSGVRKNCKWIAFHHGYTSTDLKMKLYNQLDRISLRNADLVLTVCQPFAEQMRSRGVRRDRIRVQHMPIRPFIVATQEQERLRAEFGLKEDAQIVLSVGRLSQEKGHRDLIAAFEMLQRRLRDDRLRLILVGDGPERGPLEQQVQQANLRAQVIFAGHRDDAKVFYSIANVFVLPSYSEGTPNVLLEAMAAGVPVVATAVGGVPELAIDGVSALLVTPGDPVVISEALLQVLQSRALRSQLVQSSAQVLAAHTPQAYFATMRDVFWKTATTALV